MGIILASSSPRRRELMALITPDYTVRTSDVDERAIRAETPALLAQKLAAAKCRAVAESCPEDVVIGCDTVVDVDGAVFGKPADRDDARRMIRVLAGRGHLVHTGVCIAAQGRELCFAATTKVVFGALSDAEIEAAYIVLMDDEPLKIAKAIRISRKCLRIVHENIVFALGVKILCLILGAFGIANMWLAIFADVGVMILAVLNAIRALFVKKL